ncbi:uncharacterized protein LOC141521567 [Macrotis lagotis]|uniref:uncharacterized protein LOC141521567 n=1 Tax=Macrotis lagotis TaxID=92651 RepID=UPI003D69BDB9
MGRRPWTFPKDLVQFPRKSHCNQAKSVLLPCPPHWISPLWEKDHLSQPEQMSPFKCQSLAYPHSRDKLEHSSWLHQPLADPHLRLPNPRAMAVPLPQLQPHKCQEATPAFPLHRKQDKKDRVTSVPLKSVSQCHIPLLNPKHRPESLVESNSYQGKISKENLPKPFPRYEHSVAEALIHSSQRFLLSPIADHQDGFPQFLNQRTMVVAMPRKHLNYQAKEPGSQDQTSPRPWIQARTATETATEFFHLHHETPVRATTPCLDCWSRTRAIQTLDLDHWVQAKVSHGSYHGLHLKETLSLLRCVDHHSKTLARYPISLNQRSRMTEYSPDFPNWTIRPIPHRRISNPWRKTTSVPFPLLHHIPEYLPQPDYDYQAKDIPAQLDQQETVSSKEDIATTLNDHVHWEKTFVNTEHKELIPLGPHHQDLSSYGHDHQVEVRPDPNIQIVLQKDLDQWNMGLDQEVINPILQEHQTMIPQGSLGLQDTTLPSSENYSTPLDISDRQADDMPNSSIPVKFQEKADNWEIGSIEQDHQIITPISQDNWATPLSLDIAHHNMILLNISDHQVISSSICDFQSEDTSVKNALHICPTVEDHWETRQPERDLQTLVDIYQGRDVIHSLEKDYQDTTLPKSNNTDTPPSSYDYEGQNAVELFDSIIYQQKLEPWEIISSELDHHVTATINQNHWGTLPVDTENQDTALFDPDNQDTSPSDDNYQDNVETGSDDPDWEISSELDYHETASTS